MSTRQRLVETATTLFAERGYNSTGTAEILREAGAHRGSLYHAFPNKKDLLLAVLRQYLDDIDPKLLGPSWQGVDDPIDRVFALLGRYRKFLEDTNCFFGCPIGSLALEIHDADDDVRELLAANFNAWIARVAECFAEAKDRLPPDTDPMELALFTLTTMEGGVMLSRTYRTLDAFDTALAVLRDYIARLVAARASARA